MKALMWKEFREKRLWLIPLTISTVGVVLLGKGYTFCDDIYNFTPLIGVSALLSLLMGAGTYSRELSGGTADFLYSRPVSWKKILLTKLIVGLGIIIAAALLAALAYRITVPEPYLRFTSPTDLLRGVVTAMWVMGIPFIIASFTSVVLPGMIGGILMLVAISTAVGIEMFLLDAAYDRFGYQPDDMTVVQGPILALYSWPIALFIAGLLTARFGFTLSTGARALRYVLITVAIVAVLTPVDFILKEKINEWLYKPQVLGFDINPTGRYILAQTASYQDWGGPIFLIRLSDGKKVSLGDSLSDHYWYGDRLYTVTNNQSGLDTQAHKLETVWMNSQGHEVRKTVDLGKGWWMRLEHSPNGRYAVVVTREIKNAKMYSLRLVDIEKGELMDNPVIKTSFPTVLWLSDSTFRYCDNKNVLRIISLHNQ